MVSAVICYLLSEFDLSFWHTLFRLNSIALSSLYISSGGTEFELFHELVAYFHSYCKGRWPCCLLKKKLFKYIMLPVTDGYHAKLFRSEKPSQVF